MSDTPLSVPQSIAEVQRRLQEHRKQFRKTLGYPSAEYTTVSGIQVGHCIPEVFNTYSMHMYTVKLI